MKRAAAGRGKKKWMIAALVIGLILAAFLSAFSEDDDRRVVVDQDWDFMLPAGYNVYDLVTGERLVFFSHQGIQRIDPEKGADGIRLWLAPWELTDHVSHGMEIILSSEAGAGDFSLADQETLEWFQNYVYEHYSAVVYPETVVAGIEYLTPERPWIYCKFTGSDQQGKPQEEIYYETHLQDSYVRVALVAQDEEILAENMELMRGIAGSLRYLPEEGVGADMGLHEDRLRQGLGAAMWIMLALAAAVLLGLALLARLFRRHDSLPD